MGFSRFTPGYDVPVNIGKNISEGTSGAVARADHVHEITLLHYHQNAPQITSVTTSLNGTLALTVNSDSIQLLSGTATGYSIKLPDATTLDNGWKFEIYNTGNQTVTIKLNDNSTYFTLSQNSIGYITLKSNTITNGDWVSWQVLSSSTASGIINYNLTSSTAFNTSSRNPTFVIITGFTVTPQAGTYAIWYNASVYYTTTPKAHFWAIYKAGVQLTASLRQQDTAHSNQTMVDSTMAIVSCNGSEAIDVRVSCGNTGTLTVNSRTLLLIRLGT